MGRLMDMAIKQMVANLAKEGKRLASEALRSKETKNRTLNQSDAFGYGVWFNGELKAKGYATPSRQAGRMHRGYGSVPTGYGRDWLDDWLNSFKPESKDFVLAVVNAAFYTKFLEAGTNLAQRKFRVISQIYAGMEDMAAKNKGSVTIF